MASGSSLVAVITMATALAVATPVLATDLHAAADAKANADCSQHAPCSLAVAQVRARRLAPRQREDIVIHLTGGTYRLTRPIVLTPADSGRNGHRIIWQAEAGARPVLSGGLRVSGWTRMDATRNIWRAPVAAGMSSRTFYVDGRRAERTRTRDLGEGLTVTKTGYRLLPAGDIPAFSDLRDLEAVSFWQWQVSRCQVTQVDDDEIRVPPRCFANAQRPQSLYLENAYELLLRPGQWYLDRSGRVGGVPAVYYIPRRGEDMASADAVLGDTERLVSIEGTPAHPVHDVTFRDLTFAHSGWRIDKGQVQRAGGYTGLWAAAYLLSPFDAYVVNPSRPPKQADGFFSTENMAYVDYLPAAVTADYTQRVTFDRNRFEHLGTAGLAMIRGAAEARITDNLFYDISAYGMLVGGIEDADGHPCGDVAGPCASNRVTRDTLIANNLVDTVAVEYYDNGGINVAFAHNTTIAHNELRNLPYSGISVGWGWGYPDANGPNGFRTPTIAGANRVIGNDVHDHMRRSEDGAGIYATGAQPGSEMSGNYVHKVRVNVFSGGLYLDEGSVGWTVTRNVVTDAMHFISLTCSYKGSNYGNRLVDNYGLFGTIVRGCIPGRTESTYRLDDNQYENVKRFVVARMPPEARAIMAGAGREPGHDTLNPPAAVPAP